MSKKLALVKPAAINLPATTPPPRKEDIVNALVERARVKHQEERDALEKRRDNARDELDKALEAEFWSKPSNFEKRTSFWGGSAEIEFKLRVIPPHIVKLRKTLNDIPHLGAFDPVAVKKKIREGMKASSGERVKALLANPAAVKALDATLEQIVQAEQ